MLAFPDVTTPATPDAIRELAARRAMFGAALLTVAGVAVAAIASREVGGVVLLGGWVAFVWALHAFGRAGGRRASAGEPRPRSG
jgi:hypothetical protein